MTPSMSRPMAVTRGEDELFWLNNGARQVIIPLLSTMQGCEGGREEGRKRGAVAGNSKVRRGNFGNRVTMAIWTSGACILYKLSRYTLAPRILGL